jgi:type VI secretion system secreted protein VgrG
VNRHEAVTVGKNRTKQVGQTERVTVGQHQNISVGVNRTAQVGNNDTKLVGVKHMVMITPAGEGGVTETATTYTITDKKIVLDTGAGATITMCGAEITLQAEKIHLLGSKEINGKVETGDIRLNGGPHVKVNC